MTNLMNKVTKITKVFCLVTILHILSHSCTLSASSWESNKKWGHLASGNIFGLQQNLESQNDNKKIIK